MLRPERMSRVSVTGSKAVLDEAVEAMHELRLVHVTDYDGTWDGFDPGDPVEGADEAADLLVTVRSLESILGVEADEAGHARIVTEEAIESELESVRREVNDLDDRRDELRDELRAVEEELDRLDPFTDLGIDLDLLSGYDHLTVTVGLGDPDDVRDRLADESEVEAVEVFADDDALAVFAAPAEAPVEDALVGSGFTAVEIPDVTGADGEATSPAAYADELRGRRERLTSRLETVENELEDLRLEVADFLLAAEETLAIDLERREAPLSFATTENAFVAEGWIPTERYVDLVEALDARVGDRVDVDELERASYGEHGHAHDREAVGETPGEGGTAVADGGTATGDVAMADGEPPVVQDNPDPIEPFELLVNAVNRPKYSEFDPTVVLFLTFPLFFGFMIGDVGYGLLYVAMGYVLYRGVYAPLDSRGWRALGGIALWAGGFTVLFGVLYGEFFGLHQLGEVVWGGHPPMEKGLSPAALEFAQLWLIASLLAGLVHLTVGYVFGFVEDLSHGLVEAVTENASWLFLMGGVWAWIFSGASGNAPDIMVGPESVLAEFFGFPGFSETVGLAGLGVAALGLVLLLAGEGAVGLIESLNVLVNVLSYTRIAAVLLAKGGMAFVVNLLVFGAYEHDGVFHFLFFSDTTVAEARAADELLFAGLVNGSGAVELAVGIIAGLVVLVLGHLLVLALGVTSAGLQGVRLEYVEFFSKFYEGGGEPYEPFGRERRFTAEE